MEPYQFRGNNSFDRSKAPRHPMRSRGNRTSRENFTFRHPHTSERPLLSFQRERTPEQLVSQTGSKPAFKFLMGSTTGDSKEHPVELSDSDEDSHPRKKRNMGGSDGNLDAESQISLQPAQATTKWSNPDPYTVLPPPDEGRAKRTDVIALIRNARNPNAAEKSKTQDAVTKNEDFISLGPVDNSQHNAPDDAPVKMPKRTRDDEPKGFTTKLGKSRGHNDGGTILDQLRELPGRDMPPWHTSSSEQLLPSTQLHYEILAFFDWIKPERHEEIVRADLVTRLEKTLQIHYPGSKLRAFGSFASGVYLPTADMDLVLLSKQWQNFDRNTPFDSRKSIYEVSNRLRKSGFAVSGSIETIAHAKVPIVKFVDKLTGLRIDLSFDNESGLLANDTFQDWKQDYPVMPMILAVIKQFLLLRGLNEVPTGGLGGFAITCLVTSLLQHMAEPERQNLGHILLHFFKFYGDQFDYIYTGIQMDPPEYFYKTRHDGKPRIMIMDPNTAHNDVSGGTKEIALILKVFSDAYRSITSDMHDATENPGERYSFLQNILAGNFEAYQEQRDQLLRVYETAPQFYQRPGSSRYRAHTPPPPPPPPPLPRSLPPRPPTAHW
ncbi:topoisomerase family protein TRF4 [Penicillium taxi]|uniref:topoisomerase family protein TRF4 n=1 Tax=Penicillium taxi TaxID=168475 RepID=UPI002545415E|nr:topoisomerase family protein TRF4 [Penicillium taxi]KAJ5902316.1 topoisomerase family protein TRF4 [Penicillium taxi]